MEHGFQVDQSFWDIFPETEIAVLTANNINNQDDSKVPSDLLSKANEKALKWVENDPISENDVIKDWRQAFRKFKTKKGARCAVENLLKRAKQGKGVGSINPVVDIYNSVSLEWAFPIGGEDMDKIQGIVELTVSPGDEKFFPIGEDDVEYTLPGEVIYRDDQAVLSRCMAWRDSARVEVTPETNNLIFYMENINPERQKDHRQAIKLLQERLLNYLDINTTLDILSKDNPNIRF
ncbi:B3/B4 domain-containing protein [Bombilactobacillus bombi]|uniref:B3/B4 domain-containing protein n=1 Tax=Bombilactobacillus bombi TaxID=1303590 RepID=UPI0015E5AC61|nr:phenylalanine--tRNA ligase beta subunit-related protein [Bombilactobacillus bombi]MBA1434201.1 tRNA ligase [Bombilactobacillus bombi]